MQKFSNKLIQKLVGITIFMSPWVAYAGGAAGGGGSRSVSVPAPAGIILAAGLTATAFLLIQRHQR